MKPEARDFVFAFIIGRLQDFLDLLHSLRIQRCRYDPLLPVASQGDGRKHRNRVVMLKGGNDMFAYLLFGILDRRDKMCDLLLLAGTFGHLNSVCVRPDVLARIIVGEQMLQIRERYRPVLTVHDAAVIVAPKSEVEQAVAFITEVMSTLPKWAEGLPVACEAKYGESYGDC